MNTVYCEYQSAVDGIKLEKMPKLQPIEWARRCHECQQAYEAIILQNGQPCYVISVEGGYLWVAFIDECGRCYLEYDFQEKRPNRLFLTHALYRDFIGDTDEVSNWKEFAFRENGQIFMGDYDEVAKTAADKETHDSVVENWDDYPQFGNYASLCREERS